MSTSFANKKYSFKNMLSWGMTLGIPAIILLIPLNETFTSPIRTFLAITSLAILTFAFENVPQTLVALALPVLYVAFKLAPSTTVLAPWTQNVPWMVLGGLLLADVLTENGLLKRIAYKCIIATGGSYKGILLGVVLAGVILNLMIPGKVAIPLAALSYGICKALNLGKSRASAGIMLTAATAAVAPPMMFTFYPTFFIMVNAGLEATGPLEITWLGYFTNNAVSIGFVFLTAIMAMLLFKPSTEINGKEYFSQEYHKLGGLSVSEKKSIAVVALLFLSLITTKYHGLDAGWCFAIIPLILFLPGVNAGSEQILKNVNFGFIIFVGSCMTIGATAGSLGLGKLVSTMAIPYLEGQPVTFVLVAIWVICFVLNFLLTPLAVMSAFSLPMAEIAMQLNINPLAVYFSMAHGLDQVLMPYEYALYLIYFSFGMIHLKDFIQFMGCKTIINFVFFLCILIPYWNFIGFLQL